MLRVLKRLAVCFPQTPPKPFTKSEAELMLTLGTHTEDGGLPFSLLRPLNAADMSESVY